MDFSINQRQLLEDFADISDELFEHGVITTDSFTGEIGEYVACRYFGLNKTPRVTRAVDAIGPKGEKYQVKSKVVSGTHFSYCISGLSPLDFHFLAVVYFDQSYRPLKILKIPAAQIAGTTFRITHSVVSTYGQPLDTFRLPADIRTTLTRFARTYLALEENKVIRSRRIVGDIGEFYACQRLNLRLCDLRNEKGYDATDKAGVRFEIKTRRVYESGRRVSETRRINGLIGKEADYLIVVTLDRAFRCSGMWIMPMRNITNLRSAHLKIVNTTPGVRNLVTSQIPWLKTGEKFRSF